MYILSFFLALFTAKGVLSVESSPVGHWTFENDTLTDLAGNFGDIVLKGAVLDNGQLDVGQDKWAHTGGTYSGPSISEKTLISWASIDSLSVQKGSILTIDEISTDQFDAIVFGELNPNHWMAGSSYLHRSKDPSPGYEETELNKMVQMAVSYEEENENQAHIRLYRNGELIGDYVMGNIVVWDAADTEAIWGARHWYNDINLHVDSLDMHIEESRIYDEVLTSDDIRKIYPITDKSSCSEAGDIKLDTSTTPPLVMLCSQGKWGYICGDDSTDSDHPWTIENVGVACQQLGYIRENSSTPIPELDEQVSVINPVHYHYLYCTGIEKRLIDCAHGTSDVHHGNCKVDSVFKYGVATCTTTPVKCQAGEAKLVDNVLKVCSQGDWYSVCGDQNIWTTAHAEITCKQLGMNPNGSIASSVPIPDGESDYTLDISFNCTGSELSLQECSTSHTATECVNMAAVICDVDECQTDNGGCPQICTNSIGSFSCSCIDGYTDVNSDGFTCIDINECADDTDGCQQSCNNTDGSFTCGCYPGFYLDTIDMKSCIDHDECNGTDDCEQVCNNHVGGYVCSCELGCQLNDDLTTCSDLNECDDSDCDHTCTNLPCTDGRYSCSCDNGYRLGNDNHSCIDIDECEGDSSPCSQVCNNNIGSYSCGCMSGCSLNADGTTCDDIDECTTLDVCDSVNGACQNLPCTEGMYNCSCNEGYELGSDMHSCFDINECNNAGSCNQTCSNTDGSFKCGCYSGCTLADDGFNCLDVNECVEGTSSCSQICTNTYCSVDGDGYVCSCEPGYELSDDGYSCNDIDECIRSNDCDYFCTNTMGSYTCSCNDGCEHDTVCTDVNECLLDSTNGCDQICINDNDCTNTVLYTCECNDGYILSEDDQMSCLDVNECSTNNGGCSHECTNTVGNYSCSCRDGYVLNSDGHSCDGLPCNSNLTSPSYGSISCVGGNVTDSVCTYSCSYGYYLEGNSERVCQPDHTWSGSDSECLILTCQGLSYEIKMESLLLHPCEREVETVCTVVCPKGSYVTSSNSSYNYFTQTCFSDSQDNTFWSESKTCQAIASACDPNPCQNGGLCNAIGDSAVCECPTYTTGTYCESTLLWTPDIPILTEGVESMELVLRTRPHISMEITVATDPSITVLPSHYIVYEEDDTEVSFTLLPTKAGFYSIDYVFSNFTGEILSPATTHFTVSPATDMTSLFDRYNITDSLLMGGCCLSDVRVHSLRCPLPGQSVWLSSSCGWSSEYETSGVTFLYSGDTVLPVSIVGIDSLPFNDRLSTDPKRSCKECANSRPSDDCLSAEVTPTDVDEMVEQNSLLKTFMSNIEQMLPSSVSFNIGDTRTDSSMAADSTLYHASFITDQSGLMDYTSCQALELDVNGLAYIIRSGSSGSVNIGDNVNIVKDEGTEEVCFVMDVCRLPQSPLHVSIPNSLQDTVVRTINTQFMIPQNIIQSIFSLSLSSYGTLPVSGETWFWNGNSMVSFTLPTYDASIGMFAVKEISDLKSFQSIFRMSFHGSSYGRINETVPIWLKGFFDVSIFTLSDSIDGAVSLSLSSNGDNNAVYISEQVNTTDFQPGLSMKLKLSAGNQILSSEENCMVQTYIHWNSSFYPYYYSLHSECIAHQVMGSLRFPGLTTTTSIPARRDYWPSESNIAIRVIGNNNREDPIDLGRFISIPPVSNLQRRDTNVLDQFEYRISTNNSLQSNSVLRGAYFKFLDHLLWADILLHPEPHFSTQFQLYDKYLANVDVLAIAGFSSWNDMNFRVTGTFTDDSLLNDLTDSVYELLNSQVQSLANRTALSELAVSSAWSVVVGYQDRLQLINSNLDAIQDEIVNATKQYEEALAEMNDHRVRFQSDLDLVLVSDPSLVSVVAEINAECELVNCTEGTCQFSSDMVSCDSSIPYPLISNEELLKLFVVTKQYTRSQPILSCSVDNDCDGYNGVRWLARSLLDSTASSPLVLSENSLPYSFSSHICQDKCIMKGVSVNAKENVEELANQTMVSIVSEDVLYQQDKICTVNNSCELKFLDEPCTVKNYDCESTRQLRIYSTIPVSSQQFKDLLGQEYFGFINAVQTSLLARSVLEKKRLEEKIASEELYIVTKSHENAMKNYHQAQQTLAALQDTANSTLIDWIQANGTEHLFEIDSITFAKQLNADDWSSLYSLALTVEYSVPYSGETYTTDVEISERVPLPVTMDYISRHLIDHLLLKITPNDALSLSFDNTQLLYEKNCILLQEMHWVMWNYYQQLWHLNTSYQSIVNDLDWDLARVKERSTNIIADTGGLTHVMFSSDLSNSLSSYISDVEVVHSDLKYVVAASLYTNWLNIANTHASDGIRMNCSTFVDCLRLSIELIWSRLLVVDQTNSYDRLQQASANAWTLAQTLDLTPARALNLLEPIIGLLMDMNESNGWCGVKPNMTTHPMVEVYLAIGGTGSLSCEATSLLPVKYQWWKDGQALLHENENKLEITIKDESDYGQYTCEAYNPIGSSYSLPSTVKLRALPEIHTVPTPSVVSTSEDATGVQLKCEGESAADDNYYWTWVYTRVEGGDWTEISNHSNVLIFDSIDSSNEGLYRCVLTNKFGSVYSDSFEVTVTEQSLASYSYPVSFTLEITGPAFDQSLTDSFFNLYLQQFAAAQDVNINNVTTTWITQSVVEISLYLSSIDVTMITELVSDMRSVIWKLEQGKANLRHHVESTGPLSLANTTFAIDSTSLNIRSLQIQCPIGYEIEDTLITCVPCTQGYYSTGVAKVHYQSTAVNQYYPVWVPACTPCPRGSYQQSIGATGCTACPNHYTTMRYGATSESECEALCSPGTYSDDGVHGCKDCPKGYYQPLYGSTHCLSCTGVPGMDGLCPLEETPTVDHVDRSIAIIAGSVAGGVALACLVLTCIIVVGLCIRHARRRRLKNKEEFDNGPSPFRKLSTFGTATRGVPVPEPKGNDLQVNNPIYTGQATDKNEEEVQLKQTNYDGNLKKMFFPEEKTEVTFIDDVDDKSIGETNLSTDVTFPSDIQALIETSLNENVNINEEFEMEDKGIGEANIAIDKSQQNDKEKQATIADKLVSSAITSAIHRREEDKTPLLLEDEPAEDEDINQSVVLTKELEEELSKQTPTRQSTASDQEPEEDGLETITEEDGEVEEVIPPPLPVGEDEDDDREPPLVPDVPPPVEGVSSSQEQWVQFDNEPPSSTTTGDKPSDDGQPPQEVVQLPPPLSQDDNADINAQTDELPPPIEPVIDELPPPVEPVIDELPPPVEPVIDELPPPVEPVIDELPPPVEPVIDELPPPVEPVIDELPPPIEPVIDELPPPAVEPVVDELPPPQQEEPQPLLPPVIPPTEEETKTEETPHTMKEEDTGESEERETKNGEEVESDEHQSTENDIEEELKPTALEEFSDDTDDAEKVDTPSVTPPTQPDVAPPTENELDTNVESETKKADEEQKKKDGVVFVVNDHDDSDSSNNEDGDSRILDEDLDQNVTEIVAGISENTDEHEVVMIDKADSHDKLNDYETIV